MEQLKPTEIALKRHKNTSYTHNEHRSRFSCFVLLFWAIFSYDRYIPVQTLVITLLCNVMLTVPKGAWVPVWRPEKETWKQSTHYRRIKICLQLDWFYTHDHINHDVDYYDFTLCCIVSIKRCQNARGTWNGLRESLCEFEEFSWWTGLAWAWGLLGEFKSLLILPLRGA